MQLNLDCIRRILLCVENNTGLRKYCFFIDSNLEKAELLTGGRLIPPKDYQLELLHDFSNDELIYHVHYCIKADLLSTNSLSFDVYQIVITDLTPNGHRFLENIRDNKVWNNVKNIAEKVGSKSLDAVIQIASNVITGSITRLF